MYFHSPGTLWDRRPHMYRYQVEDNSQQSYRRQYMSTNRHRGRCNILLRRHGSCANPHRSKTHLCKCRMRAQVVPIDDTQKYSPCTKHQEVLLTGCTAHFHMPCILKPYQFWLDRFQRCCRLDNWYHRNTVSLDIC